MQTMKKLMEDIFKMLKGNPKAVSLVHAYLIGLTGGIADE